MYACIYVCMCIWHKYIHACMHSYIHTYIQLHLLHILCVSMHAYTYTPQHTQTQVFREARAHCHVENFRPAQSLSRSQISRASRLSWCMGALPNTSNREVLAIWVLGPNPQGTPGNNRVLAGSLPLCFSKGTRLKMQHLKASFLQTIASQTQGHSAICSWEHPKEQSCPLPKLGHLEAKPKGTARLNHARSRYQRIRFMTRTCSRAFRSEAEGHSAI